MGYEPVTSSDSMKRFALLFMVLQVPVDAVMLLFAGVAAYALRLSNWAVELKPILFDLSFAQYMHIVVQFIPVWLIIFAFLGLYTPSVRRRFAQDIARIFVGSLVGLAFIALYIVFTQTLFDSRFLVAVSTVCAFVFVAVGRLWLRGVKALCYRAGFGLRRAVIIGNDVIANELERIFKKRLELGYHVVGTFPSFSDEVAKKISRKKVDEMIITNPRGQEKSSVNALHFAHQKHIGFKYSADLFLTLSPNTTVHPLAGFPIVEVKPTRLEGWGRVLKRLYDVIFSASALIILSPVYILTALVIVLETGLPVIYKNDRVGVRGKSFTTFKFRSMFQKDSTGKQFGASGRAAQKREQRLINKQNSRRGPIYKIKDDPRVTLFGRFLRRWSVDELPQFWNVLIGNMSVVGPRPHQPREVAGYDKKHHAAFSVKPGITGLAQISGRSDLTYEEEMRLDILYIEKWSLWLDVIICIKTPFVLLKRRKAL
jgi:exopolysaccharide biosynthesis polyprenyl glycosylphosphotransferase